MKQLKLIVISIFLSLCLAPAYGIDLDTAKKQLLVGETDGGYIAAVGAGNNDLNALVKSINSQRKKHYQTLAKKNSVALGDIEQLAGKKSIAKTAKGLRIRIAGKWSKKK